MLTDDKIIIFKFSYGMWRIELIGKKFPTQLDQKNYPKPTPVRNIRENSAPYYYDFFSHFPFRPRSDRRPFRRL